MANVDGRLASVIKGVSQQAPYDRIEGQMAEQVNMITDPVRGLVRRNGFLLTDHKTVTTSGSTVAEQVSADSYRTYQFAVKSDKFAVMYRSRARLTDTVSSPLIQAYSLGYPQKFMEVQTLGDLSDYIAGGISSVTAVGEYVLFAGKTHVPTIKVTDKRADSQRTGVVQIVSGNYNRTYKIRWRGPDGIYSGMDVTTPSADYPETLDISGVEHEPADTYQQRLNDVLYAYESGQNAWRVSSSQAIVPSAIAAEFIRKLEELMPGHGWIRDGATLIHKDIDFLTVSDDSNNESIKKVFREVAKVEELTAVAPIGMVVKVKPLRNSEEAYYMEAVESQLTTQGKVEWRECAGEEQVPQSVFLIGKVLDMGNEHILLVAPSPAELDQLVADNIGPDQPKTPTFAPSNAGDTESVATPAFFGQPITMLAYWQNRLFIGTKGAIVASAIGDYFNWFRKSMLTLTDSDAIADGLMAAHGDTLRKSQILDGNLMVFGEHYHYLIDGQTVLTANAPRFKQLYRLPGTSEATPETNGPMVFMLKEDTGNGGSCRLLQARTGMWRDSTDLADVSMQLRDYINGTPAELVALASPSMCFVRTEPLQRSEFTTPSWTDYRIYVYQYTDTPDQSRAQEAWGSWAWDAQLGKCVSIASTDDGDGITMVLCKAVEGRVTYLLLNCSARVEPTGLPYLDACTPALDADETPIGAMARKFTAVDATASNIEPTQGFALDDPWQSFGDAAPEVADPERWFGMAGGIEDVLAVKPAISMNKVWTGIQYPAFVDITMPFYRNRFDKTIIAGRLILTRLRVFMSRTAGFRALVRDHDETFVGAEWSGEYQRFEIGTSVAVGRDTANCQVRLMAVDWFPLGILSIEWDGNFYKNGRGM